MIKQLIKKEYDNLGAQWREKVWVNDEDFQKEIIKFADVGGNERALDVGIGAGDLIGLLTVRRVTGVDISERMIAECRKLHPSYELLLGDAEHLPFADNLFDLVCCRNLLQNFLDPNLAFSEMFRVLKSGGKFLTIESAVYENERQFPTRFCRIIEPFYPLFPSHEMLKLLFDEYGLKNVSQEVHGVYRKWLAKWQKSKNASDEERRKGYEICKKYPEWYRKKHKFKFYPDELEIRSLLSFSFLKGYKP